MLEGENERMPIPHSERVIYERNPLEEVICQLRFPRQLVIDAEAPARFQTAIASEYPTLIVRDAVQILIEASAPKFVSTKTYDFSSADEKWKVVLNSEFIALTTTRYISWGEFLKKLATVLGVFLEFYGPAYFSRIGIRYKDIISRKALGVDNVPWKDLIEPHLISVLGDDKLEISSVLTCVGSFSWEASAETKAQMNYGLANNKDNESVFLIDMDYFSDQRTEATINGPTSFLGRVRPLPYDVFRWCIKDDLHSAMGPRSPSADE